MVFKDRTIRQEQRPDLHRDIGSTLSCRISSCPGADRLAPIWCDLQERANGSVFLAWPWIDALLRLSTRPFWLAEIHQGDALVGLGVIGSGGHFNESGDPALDSIMIEYNGLLTLAGLEQPAAAALLDAIPAGWGSLALSGVEPFWQELCHARGWLCRQLRQSETAPYLALNAQRANGMPPSLSRNGRAQAQRSLRHFAEFGAVRLDRASHVEQAIDWLAQLAVLHNAAWQARGTAGAFVNQVFGSFHQCLIRTGFDQGVIDLFRLSAGETVLGYLYNLRWREVAYAYQSGFVYQNDAAWRPGLVAHLLAIRHYGAENLRLYRLLSGESRYKARLSNGADRMLWLLAERPTKLKLAARRVRDLKQRVTRMLDGRPWRDH